MSDLQEKFKDFSKITEGKSEFLLIGHEQPDGDAIGALLALDIVVGIISIHTLNAITDIILSLSYFLIALLALSLLMSLIMLCIAFIFKKGKKLIIIY